MYLAIITAFAAVFSTIGQLNGLESVYMESNTEQHSIPEFLYKIISPEQWEESLHVNYVAPPSRTRTLFIWLQRNKSLISFENTGITKTILF